VQEGPEGGEVGCCEGGKEFNSGPEVEGWGVAAHGVGGVGVHPGREEFLCLDDGSGTGDKADANG